MDIFSWKMTKSPFLSIITASLNNDASIKKTIESVKNQSFQALEHIVIDGGSYDNTLDILEGFNGTYNLAWISEPDNGIADALNKGLKKARGRYILVIHADDHLLSPKILEIVYPLLKPERFDIHSFPVIQNIPPSGKVLRKPIPLLWWYHFKTIFPHQGCFVHKRVYDCIGGYQKEFSIALDYDFFYRVLSTRPSVKLEKRPVALMGGKGISSNQDFLIQRLQEEVQVQNLNENNRLWRLAQLLFRILYFPYKTSFLPKLQSHLKGFTKSR